MYKCTNVCYTLVLLPHRQGWSQRWFLIHRKNVFLPLSHLHCPMQCVALTNNYTENNYIHVQLCIRKGILWVCRGKRTFFDDLSLSLKTKLVTSNWENIACRAILENFVMSVAFCILFCLVYGKIPVGYFLLLLSWTLAAHWGESGGSHPSNLDSHWMSYYSSSQFNIPTKRRNGSDLDSPHVLFSCQERSNRTYIRPISEIKFYSNIFK